MRFLNFPGLWLLLGIPVLIIIYLIKSRYEERPVSSTYIWKLSEKFMKQRVPLQKLKKFLVFLMQLAIIAGVAFMAAQPAIEKGEVTQYIVILDASASMNTKNSVGETRFERALEAIASLAEETEAGHTVSLIVAGETANCVISRSDSETTIKRSLKNLTCTNGTADLEGAITIAQNLIEKNTATEVLLFTDRPEGENENLTVIDLSEDERNLTVSGLSYSTGNGQTIFTGTVLSNRTETVTVGLRVNGKLKDAAKVDLIAGETTSVRFTADLTSFDSAEVYVETSDGLTGDNAYAVCRSEKISASVLIYSDSPTYLKKVFEAQKSCTVTVGSSTDEAVALSGYDLYIFDGILPKEIPTDGSVLYINTATYPEGISVERTVSTEGTLCTPVNAAGKVYTDLSFHDTVVSVYGSLSTTTDWEALLFCDDDVVCVSRTLSTGLKEIVLSFDLHDTNLTLQTSFVILARNLLSYSVPQILEETDCTVGETIRLAILPGAETLYVKTPDNSTKAVSGVGNYGVYVPEGPGIYTAVETTAGGGEYMDFFVHFPESELKADEAVSGLSVELPENSGSRKSAVKKLVFWVALIALILVLGEWGVTTYERY